MDLHLVLHTLVKNDLSINQYTLCLKAIYENLFAIGETIYERDILLYRLGGLDSSYNSFVSSITILIRKEHITFEDL